MKKFAYAAVAVLVPFAAAAHDAVAIEDAYARSSNPKSGAVFMLLDNHRKVDCTLKSVASDAAAKVMLHKSEETDGVMKMGEMSDGLAIPAGGEQLLERGGNHVMLMGLKAPLEDGQEINLSLDFGECGAQDITVPVDNQREGTEASEHEDDDGDQGQEEAHEH